MSIKNLNFSLHEEWETHGQSFTWQRITKFLEHISSKIWENCRGPESGPEHGGIGSVIELAMAKQVYENIDHFTTGQLESCRSFDRFILEASLKKILVYFFLVTRSIFSCCLWGFAVPLFCSLMPNVKVLRFSSEIIKRLLGETHVFGRTFISWSFPCYGGSLYLVRHVVDLSVSISMSQPAETT